ncbi:MAG: hypothetical protein ACFFAN_15805 [Promethearchaeota archaeon]
MDKKIKNQIISNFKDIDKNSKFFKSNPDLKRTLELTIKDPSRLIDENDSFNFDNNICITRCDGHCCFDIDLVRVSPIDVEYMLKSPFFKDFSRKQIVEQYIDLFLGGESLIPMAIVRMNEVDGINICPFIAIAKKIEIKNSEIKDKGIGGICLLRQKYKPTICLLYPLGRIHTVNPTTNNKSIAFIVQDCEGTKTDKKVCVRNHIADYIEKSKINDNYVREMSKIVDRLKNTFHQQETIRLILIKFLFYLYFGENELHLKLNTIIEATDKLIRSFNKYKEMTLDNE